MRLNRWVIVGLALAAVSACDLIQQATANHVLLGTVLTTPTIEIKGNALVLPPVDFDASFPADSGFSFDAGTFLNDAGLSIPPQSVAYIFFGTIPGPSSIEAPMGVSGAQATVGVAGGAQVAVNDVGSGAYLLIGNDGGVGYVEGAKYQLNIKSGGALYTCSVDKAPGVEKIPELHPSAGYLDLARNTAVVLNRPDLPGGGELNLGFIAVFGVDVFNGKDTKPTWTNLPQTPLELLQLVAAPIPWRQKSFTIPGSAFPEAGKNYVIVFQSAKMGGPDTPNLSVLSLAAAGTADLGIVKTH